MCYIFHWKILDSFSLCILSWVVSSELVSRPTRWSLWYWYLDVYVNHISKSKWQRNIVQRCATSEPKIRKTRRRRDVSLKSFSWGAPCHLSLHVHSNAKSTALVSQLKPECSLPGTNLHTWIPMSLLARKLSLWQTGMLNQYDNHKAWQPNDDADSKKAFDGARSWYDTLQHEGMVDNLSKRE